VGENFDRFTEYLKKTKKMSRNTQEAYRRDILDFFKFIREKDIADDTQVSNTEIVSYLLKMKSGGLSSATVNRRLASVRSYYSFMCRSGLMQTDPTDNIKSPRIERKEIEYLTIEEVDRLLASPADDAKGSRDRAMLELMYATGIRVNEAVAANVEDVNLRIGFFTCPGNSGKARIIPIGRPARAAAEKYIFETRAELIRDNKEERALFVNYYGKRMTRQGLWKILKEYGKKAGIADKLTPHSLRNSFAVHMIQNGADLKSLQELLGHEDISATQIYLSVTKNKIKDVYDRTHPRA